MVHLQALGGIDLRYADGARVEPVLAQPKRLALLAYLSLERRGGLHARDELIAMFWPESDTRRARDALSQALQFLRRHLGEHLFRMVGDGVAVTAGAVEDDVGAVEEAVAGRRWAEAVDLYRGELLPGLYAAGAPQFSEWVDRKRRRLAVGAAEAARAAVEEAASVGRREEGVRLARRWVEIEPHDGEAAEWLLRLSTVAESGGHAERSRRPPPETALSPAPGTPETASLETSQAAPQPTSEPGPAVVPRQRRIPPGRRRSVVIGIAFVSGLVPGALWVAAWAMREESPPPIALVLDFTSSDDPVLGRTVAELLRVDLGRSGAVQIPSPGHVEAGLARMERDTADLGTEAVALELATREGYAGVLGGEVRQLGAGWALTARVLDPGQGDVIARFRAIATDETGFVAAVESLSREIRSALGTAQLPLADPRPLAQVTTASLPALRAFSMGDQLLREGRRAESRQFYEDAIRYDSQFVMAFVRLQQAGGRFDSAMLEAVLRNLDRLPPLERLAWEDVSFLYATTWEERRSRLLGALRNLESHVRAYPHDEGARILLAHWYFAENDYDSCLRVLDGLMREARRDSVVSPPMYDLAFNAHMLRRDLRAARRTAAELRRVHGEIYQWLENAAELAYAEGDLEAAHAYMESALERSLNVPAALHELTLFDLLRGRFREAEEHQRRHAAVPGLPPQALVMEATIHATVVGAVLRDTARARTRLDTVLTRLPPEITLTDLPTGYMFYVYGLVGDHERAREVMEARRPDTVPESGHGMYGQLFLLKGDMREAERRLRIAVARAAHGSPGNQLDFGGSLGEALEANGKVDEAIAVLKQYLANGRAHRHYVDSYHLVPTLHRLARLHEARGEHRRAAEYLQRFAELWKDADPELQPRVRAALEKAAELRRRRL